MDTIYGKVFTWWYKEREIMQKKVTEQKRNDCTRKQKN